MMNLISAVNSDVQNLGTMCFAVVFGLLAIAAAIEVIQEWKTKSQVKN